MSSITLTQADLNESLRGLAGADIMMFMPDKNISFPKNAVSSNKKTLRYTTNLQSLLEFSSLPQANIATFENNSWILDGSFISPSETYGGGGDSYTGFISNDMTDDEGNYPAIVTTTEETTADETTTEDVEETAEGVEETEDVEEEIEYDNPILTVTLSAVAPIVEYLSVQFSVGVDSSYPKIFKIRTFLSTGELINEHVYDMTEQTGLPLLVVPIYDENVKSVEFEFVGTLCPHRRSRLNKIMFGKAEQVDKNLLKSWKLDDKASLVADSIPTKELVYEVINYQGDYDIDNPGNKIPINYQDAYIFFTLGIQQDGLWKYAPTKIFSLTDISTTSDGLVVFTGGSLLDTLTETYDHDIYSGTRTISEVMRDLLTFSGVGTDQCELNEFGDYEINIPLPEQSVRELIQRLAFSCGATLTIDDNNRIIFSKKNIIPTDDTPKFMFHQPDPFNSAGVLLEEPKAEALSNTTNIGMYTYDSIIDDEVSELGTVSVSIVNPTRVTFSPASGSAQFDEAYLEEQHAQLASISEVYSQHAIITLTWKSSATPPISVKILGQKVTTTKVTPKTANMNTLLLDSGLALTVPDNLVKPVNPDSNTFYYTDWYGAKFKYVCKTRKEYLIKAGDIIYFETPFSNGKPNRVGYVLRNSYSSENDYGEMEVITIGNS